METLLKPNDENGAEIKLNGKIVGNIQPPGAEKET